MMPLPNMRLRATAQLAAKNHAAAEVLYNGIACGGG
jgi:hypothetical protein